MIVFFEDGSIETNTLRFKGKELLKVNAKMGYSHCRKQLRDIKETHPFNTMVYTNSLDAFSNFWCWSDEEKTPLIYVRDKNGMWTLISELTTRELRASHNLAKLYVNGEFVDVAQ